MFKDAVSVVGRQKRIAPPTVVISAAILNAPARVNPNLIDPAPVAVMAPAALIVVPVDESTVTIPVLMPIAAVIPMVDPVESMSILPLPEESADAIVTAPEWFIVIALFVVVIVPPVLSKVVPFEVKPPAAVTFALISTAAAVLVLSVSEPLVCTDKP